VCVCVCVYVYADVSSCVCGVAHRVVMLCRYLTEGTFLCDTSKLTVETFELVFGLLSETPSVNTFRMTDSVASLRMRSRSSSSSSSSSSVPSAASSASSAPQQQQSNTRRRSSASAKYLSDSELQLKLTQTLPTLLPRYHSTLRHFELISIRLPHFSSLFQALSGCTALRRLYLRACPSIGDRHLPELMRVVQALPALNHLALSGCGLSGSGGVCEKLLCGFVGSQSVKRDTTRWEMGLRRSGAQTGRGWCVCVVLCCVVCCVVCVVVHAIL